MDEVSTGLHAASARREHVAQAAAEPSAEPTAQAGAPLTELVGLGLVCCIEHMEQVAPAGGKSDVPTGHSDRPERLVVLLIENGRQNVQVAEERVCLGVHGPGPRVFTHRCTVHSDPFGNVL